MSLSWRSTRSQNARRERWPQIPNKVNVWWTSMTGRERLLVSLAGVLLCVYLVWAFIFEPAMRTITLAQTQLPQLRSDAALVGAIARQAKTIDTRSSVDFAPASLSAALQRSLEDSDLSGHIGIERLPENAANKGWILTIHDTPATKLMPWLTSLSNIMPVKIRRVQLERSQTNGPEHADRVSGNIELTISKEQ